ncbi:hypothetical protein [Alkaliphilus crotonatoxidans]
MEQDKLKVLKIVNELAIHCMALGASHLEITISNIDNDQEKKKACLKCSITHLDQVELEKLKEQLAVSRQEEFEDYLWGLAGQSLDYRRLNLVGMMIDYADVTYEDSILKITIYR